MTTTNLTLNEVRKKGLDALKQALGPADMIRFLNDLQPGSGDYTKDRHAWLDNSDVKTILDDLQPK